MRPMAGLLVTLSVIACLPAGAVDLSVSTGDYSTGGLFTRPLIPAEKDVVTIGVRAKVEGDVGESVPAELSITAPDGRTRNADLTLQVSEGEARGLYEWKAWANGVYSVAVKLDPGDEIAETNEANNGARLTLPIVIQGRQPWFPWFGQKTWLRWANIWAGGFDKTMIAHWQERGVMPLAWKWGNNYPKDATEEDFERMYSDAGGTEGIAVDECGYYPFTLLDEPPTKGFPVGKFVRCLQGMAKAKEANPDKFFLLWQSGTFYPEQAALYRRACDLVVIESYVSYFAPKGLYTENVYDFLDMKMRAARQVDMLNATGKGPQVITSIDLRPENFNRGQVEAIVRHLRRNWPEMRGFGIFGGLVGGDTKESDRAGLISDEQFVDSLCYEYFVKPVVTILPGSVWVTRAGDDTCSVQASISNIGGMDAGPVEVGLYVDGQLLERVELPRVPAGDSLLENRALASAAWEPEAGNHTVEARILEAAGSTVLDARGECEWFVGR